MHRFALVVALATSLAAATAAAYGERANKLAQQAGQKIGEGDDLAAAELFEKAAAAAPKKAKQWRKFAAGVLTNAGDLFYGLNEHARAAAVFEQAAEILHKLEQPGDSA